MIAKPLRESALGKPEGGGLKKAKEEETGP